MQHSRSTLWQVVGDDWEVSWIKEKLRLQLKFSTSTLKMPDSRSVFWKAEGGDWEVSWIEEKLRLQFKFSTQRVL